MARKSETDLSRYDLTKGTRGKYLEKARRSFETIVVDKKIVAALGGPEGLTTILEALACGLPVVAFGVEGVLDAIQDGHTGFLSPTQDSEGLASRITACLLDDEGRSVMARNAREDAVARFDANRQGTDYASLLSELCAGGR